MSDHADADRAWTVESVNQLKELARERITVSVMSLKLKRSVPAVRSKLAELGLAVPSDA